MLQPDLLGLFSAQVSPWRSRGMLSQCSCSELTVGHRPWDSATPGSNCAEASTSRPSSFVSQSTLSFIQASLQWGVRAKPHSLAPSLSLDSTPKFPQSRSRPPVQLTLQGQTLSALHVLSQILSTILWEVLLFMYSYLHPRTSLHCF